MEANIKRERFALYCPGIVFSDKIKQISNLNDSLSNFFDGEPLMIPASDDEAPPEVPRIVLRTKNEEYELIICFNVLHFIAKYKDKKDSKFPNVKYQETFQKIVDYFKHKINSNFTRIANITTWHINLDKGDSVNCLRESFLRDNIKFNQLSGMELEFLEKTTVGGYDINQLIRIRASMNSGKSESEKIINLQIDLGSISEKKYEIDINQLTRYFSEMEKMVNGIVSKYIDSMTK